MTITTPKGKKKQLHSGCINPFPKSALFRAKRKLPNQNEFSFLGKEEQKKKKKKKNKASDSFPRLSAQEGKILASPHPETNKAKMYREG